MWINIYKANATPNPAMATMRLQPYCSKPTISACNVRSHMLIAKQQKQQLKSRQHNKERNHSATRVPLAHNTKTSDNEDDSTTKNDSEPNTTITITMATR
eukprot:m.127159 g.127159  ORF g.127159 m.127159 type:complete len:100 (-) comp29252_c1_seq1:196-495(-)